MTDLCKRLTLARRGIVLAYHRVLQRSQAGGVDPGMWVDSAVFADHLDYLSESFELVSLDAFGDWIAGKTSFRRPPCVLTFDDGWLDNYLNAFPLLKRFKAPATIFLATQQVGQPDRLTWAQAREMEGHGIRFGSHTATHAVMTTVNRDTARDEIRRSKADLREHLAYPSGWFCYPKGFHSRATREIVRELVDGALTFGPGSVRQGDDFFRVRRIGIHNDISETRALFACRLLQPRGRAQFNER